MTVGDTFYDPRLLPHWSMLPLLLLVFLQTPMMLRLGLLVEEMSLLVNLVLLVP